MRVTRPDERRGACASASWRTGACGALCGRSSEHIGGIERQSALWARWFAARGHGMTLVTWDVGQAERLVDGVRVVTLCRPEAGLPGLRFFHPRWTSLTRALARADADLYACICGDASLGQSRSGAACGGGRSPTMCRPPRRSTARCRIWPGERLLHRLGLRRAQRVTVQTLLQQGCCARASGSAPRSCPCPAKR